MDLCFICGMTLVPASDGSGRMVCPICGNVLPEVILETPNTTGDK